MNFFGHAVVAEWTGARPEGVLGSMLPDFEAMLKVRLIHLEDPEIQKGVVLHHRTDEAFHRASSFLSLCTEALAELSRCGVRRGTGRAVAHIGTEMFLDGRLADHAHADRYTEALDPEVTGRLRWADEGKAFDELSGRLRRWGPPHDYRIPSFVLERLEDALRTRPRLRILDEDRDRLRAFLPRLQRDVERRAPELLAEVRNALGLDR